MVGKACTGTAEEISSHLLLSPRLSRSHFTERQPLPYHQERVEFRKMNDSTFKRLEICILGISESRSEILSLSCMENKKGSYTFSFKNSRVKRNGKSCPHETCIKVFVF